MTAFQPEPFGKYYLVDKIAVGGMAEIFKAKSFGHAGFEKLLVIKRILPHISANEEFVEMFVDEAKVSVALQHANIVQTYDFGKVLDNFFIAMECVDGKDVKALLRKLAQRRRFLPIEFGVYIAQEVAKGLDYAHRRQNLQGHELGIVHRDMSPSNVIISYDGEVKIADFGIAKASTNAYTTKDGVLKGKFEYMSPEQAQGQDIDRRSDIFSCGIILYECLTGRRLFKCESDVKTLEAIKACNLDPPSALNPNIPARLDEIVMRALARRREDRYAEARELQNDLLEFLYPATSDLVRQSFAHFLKELFGEEIAGERQRLEEGTRIALALHHQAPDLDLEPEWEEPRTTASHTLPGASGRAPAPRRWPLVIAALVPMALLVVVAAWLAWEGLEPDEPVITVPEVTTGRLLVLIDTEAEVLVDGQLVGLGQQVAVEELAAGPHQIEVRAEGRQPYSDTITVEPGEKVRFPVRLEPEVLTPPEPLPQPESPRHVQPPEHVQPPPERVEPEPPAAAPATLTFTSSPSGASVVADGVGIGRTPTTWTGGTPGAAVYVEYRLDGYQSQGFTVRVPEAGGSDSESRGLKPVAKEPGHVSVNVSRGWAYVYIDGKKLEETTPLINEALPPGSHTIRVLNEALGIDASKSVQIESGERVERVFFKVD
ncbi:MAG: serine/threonine-protein kinase [Pseudomonadota bacterium]